MDVGKRIKNRRKELGLTIEQVAKRLGKTASTISRYESGEIENFPITVLNPIAMVLRCTPGYLMGWEELPITEDPILSNVKNVPVLGEISCGLPIIASEVKESMAMLCDGIEADFALKCKGDSMINARIYDGDIVFLKKTEEPNNGDIVAAVIDDETTLKRIYLDQANDVITLVPENPIYPILRYYGEETEHIRIIGKAVAFQSCIR